MTNIWSNVRGKWMARSVFWWLLYGVGCFLWAWVFNTFHLSYVEKVAVALLSMLPAVFAISPLVQSWREKDELQMRVSAEGIIFSFIGTALVTWTYGFLELYAALPHLTMWSVWPLMAVLWGVGTSLATRRYR